MIGLVFTTTEEAHPFVDTYADGRFSDLGPDAPLHDDHVLVSVSEQRELRFGLDIGALVGVTAVLEGDRIELSAPSYPQMPLEVPFETDTQGILVTQDHVVQDSEDRSYWQRIADVNDSSGYALAYVAAQHGVSCHIAKAVTAHAGEENESFQKDRAAAQQRIADCLLAYLNDQLPA